MPLPESTLYYLADADGLARFLAYGEASVRYRQRCVAEADALLGAPGASTALTGGEGLYYYGEGASVVFSGVLLRTPPDPLPSGWKVPPKKLKCPRGLLAPCDDVAKRIGAPPSHASLDAGFGIEGGYAYVEGAFRKASYGYERFGDRLVAVAARLPSGLPHGGAPKGCVPLSLGDYYRIRAGEEDRKAALASTPPAQEPPR